MNRELQRFVTVFRELEQKQYSCTSEELHHFEAIKHKLTFLPYTHSTNFISQRSIAIASLYPQAGSSFIASNVAVSQANKRVKTTLCELPTITPYYYFALDCERRGLEQSNETIIPLVRGDLKVKPVIPFSKLDPLSQNDITSWYLRNHKECSLLIIDISHQWRSEMSSWICKWVDEIWLVVDTNFPRITSFVLTDEASLLWEEHRAKIRIIANRWSPFLSKMDACKKLEGTLSLWNAISVFPKIKWFMPMHDSEKNSISQMRGKFLLECYPEEGEAFEELGNSLALGGDL